MTRTVPDGFTAKGVSTLYREDGTVAAQWVKSTQAPGALESAMRTVVDAMCEDVRALAKPITCPKYNLARSLSSYNVGDAHFGLYAWHKEAGEDFDTDVASSD